MIVYAIYTPKGYLATQGNQKWFQGLPIGWSQFTDKQSALMFAEMLVSDIGYKIEEIKIKDKQ